MSSSIFCDRILLLQDGKIAAHDSHDNLMKAIIFTVICLRVRRKTIEIEELWLKFLFSL